MKTVILIIDTGIVHINPHIFRFYHLGAKCQIPVLIGQ